VTTTTALDETPIWRYMDLPKFVQMLASRCLWFPKVIRFDDPFECLGVAIPPEMPTGDSGPKSITHTDGGGAKTQISIAEMGAQFGALSAIRFESSPECLYINSWCLAVESMAMWEIYGSGGRGIAVKSSIGQFRRAVDFGIPETQYALGPVRYHGESSTDFPQILDLRRGSIPLIGPSLWRKMMDIAFHKRACYEYENEWRAVLYQDPRPDIRGIDIQFAARELIAGIYIGPRAEPFLFHAVEAISEKFGLTAPIQRSSLLVAPSKAIAAS
jgi:hypothetical protein